MKNTTCQNNGSNFGAMCSRFERRVTWLGLAVKVERCSVEHCRVETGQLSLGGRSVTILHTCTLHTQNEGGLDEPFKAGCSKSVLRLNDKFEPQILGRAMSLASPILKRAMQVGRWQVAGKVFQSGFSTT